MKGQVRVLNLARGELVNDDDMIAALGTGRVAKYVTDFPNAKIAVAHNVVALPHLGASTPESEENCAVMAVRQLEDYLVNGNIVNSVNMPNLSQEWSGIARICLLHKNIPAMLTKITTVLSEDHINVENLTNIVLWYGARYQVNLGDTNEIEKKISYMNQAVAQLSEYQIGVLDVSFVTWPDQVGFTPAE